MKSSLIKLVLWPVLMAGAVLLAGVYGALHNQISYTVAPAYFHEFKFAQFGIEPSLHNRVGAAIVGVRASWWMGLLIGTPIFGAALFVKGRARFVWVFCIAALITVVVTLLVGLGALGVGIVSVDASNLPGAMARRGVSDPVAFAHAGIMHDASYLGGVIGMVCGCIYATTAVVFSNRAR